MKKILVAVDGSEPALKGVRLAAELAKASQASLLLTYVSPPNLLPAHVYGELVRELEEQEKRYAKEILKAAVSEASAAGIAFEELRGTGSPAETISDLADANDVWMVVVGSRGHGAVSRVLLGSVADRLAHICRKPVLVVR